ncbi:hypothetical protein RN001_016111 [Aquatica leii]|uniref:glutathione-specific gamma-glutamylcyclotransferase n=1 Tax=Aquatica leii TaxID=1421715 RepID=A0AAN7PNT8_9COLE|nr:hypothetical protein RN001_016111 [Aquatica leii]
MEQISAVVELQDFITENETKSLWIFGYGSLCWNPGFLFEKAVAGRIQGYSRKFWQGNDTHRGTKQQPGRVVTLVKDNDSAVYGIAFQITGESALSYLNKRESTAQNELWLGDAPLCDIANQITDSKGDSGYNVEYLLRLARFMRHHFPYENDDHLYSLERLVTIKIIDRKMCLKTLMGDGRNTVTFIKKQSFYERPVEEVEERIDSFQYTTRVPEKALRVKAPVIQLETVGNSTSETDTQAHQISEPASGNPPNVLDSSTVVLEDSTTEKNILANEDVINGGTTTSDLSNTPGTSSTYIKLTTISPLPKSIAIRSTNRISKKSEIITSSPYKDQLIEEEEKKNPKPKVKLNMGDNMAPPQTLPRGKFKRELEVNLSQAKCGKADLKKAKTPPHKKMWSCPGCNETFKEPVTEDWIECTSCAE